MVPVLGLISCNPLNSVNEAWQPSLRKILPNLSLLICTLNFFSFGENYGAVSPRRLERLS